MPPLPKQELTREEKLATLMQSICGLAQKLQLGLLTDHLIQQQLKEEDLFEGDGNTLAMTPLGKATANKFAERN